ncbi:hypothetical protein LTS18_014568, partial [Coniosporium uncinatum]
MAGHPPPTSKSSSEKQLQQQQQQQQQHQHTSLFGGFRTRAASILHPSQHFDALRHTISPPSASAGDTSGSSNEKTDSSSNTAVDSPTATTANATVSIRGDEHGNPIRTLPPWVRSVDADEDIPSTRPAHHPLHALSAPAAAKAAQHHYVPQPRPREGAAPGRVYDHARTKEIVFARPLYGDGEGGGRGKRWATFARSTQDPEK